MKIPLQITFHEVAQSDQVEAYITRAAEDLERAYGEIISCRVVVDVPHRRHRTGNLYQVRIDVSVPGGELVVNREPGDRNAHGDLYVAINDAFAAMARNLMDYVQERRGEVKRSVAAPHGVVTKLFPDEDYGFIETSDGRDIYFHRNSVLKGGFPLLKVGTEVRYREEQGLEGPQASTVEIVGEEATHDYRTHDGARPPVRG